MVWQNCVSTKVVLSLLFLIRVLRDTEPHGKKISSVRLAPLQWVLESLK